MNTRELRTQPAKDLQRLLQERRAHVRQLRFDIASGKTKQTKELRETKKTIARILTITRQNQ